ncbi:acyl esterase [Planomonospora sp. ID67723]|uniref:CocE/NonD family hydrolase n=1 Tax=Planomonospora sp. ID67723 TaxID=2738134 RepID=UPI001A18A3FE|nr:CocE/NonD family hydrolase [Planomonospora sp. ID67723]MBG0832398.1 acyl esterase [Planomonospora sp. ID67723]
MVAALGAPASAAVSPAAPPAVAVSAVAEPSFRTVEIPVAADVVLKGNVFVPAGADAAHPAPVVILPTSWAMPQIEYLAQAKKLAEQGFVAVTYVPRGFWGSGGTIGVAGADDIGDVSRVVDWALAGTPADPARVGAAGVSYGAGLSLLGAAADPRIRAVAAMSGWADLTESLYGGGTQHLMAAGLLDVAGRITGRPSPELEEMLDEFYRGENIQKVMDWAGLRSAAAHVDRINANGTAVMISNAWGDSIFPPNQVGDFFDRLTGPKLLQMRPGDHATTEGLGLVGLPNDAWRDARDWLAHHLAGADNGIDREGPVVVQPKLQDGYETYPSWAGLAGSRLELRLGDEDWLRNGKLDPDAGTGWTTTIRTGLDSGASSGLIFASPTLEQLAKLPPMVPFPALLRTHAGIWRTPKLTEDRQVRGAARLHVTLTPTAADGTLFAYLYDVDALGVGRLIAHTPYGFTGRRPGVPFAADVTFQSTAYDVSAGHRLALVVDTVDPAYKESNPARAKVTFSSPEDDPSRLSVPLR